MHPFLLPSLSLSPSPRPLFYRAVKKPKNLCLHSLLFLPPVSCTFPRRPSDPCRNSFVLSPAKRMTSDPSKFHSSPLRPTLCPEFLFRFGTLFSIVGQSIVYLFLWQTLMFSIFSARARFIVSPSKFVVLTPQRCNPSAVVEPRTFNSPPLSLFSPSAFQMNLGQPFL